MTPCITKGCIYSAEPPARVCQICMKTPPPYERQEPVYGMQNPPYGMQSPPPYERQEAAYGRVVNAPPETVKQKCKGLDCQFYGDNEFRGYCSECFLNITKQEASQKQSKFYFYHCYFLLNNRILSRYIIIVYIILAL